MSEVNWPSWTNGSEQPVLLARRCETTNNPCGTDAHVTDHPCRCRNCVLYLSEENRRRHARIAALEAALRAELPGLETSVACTARTAAGRLRKVLDEKGGGS